MDNNFKVNKLTNTTFNRLSINKDPEKEKQNFSKKEKEKKETKPLSEEELLQDKPVKINTDLGKFINLKL